MITRLKSRLDVPLLLVVLLTAFLNGYNIWTDQYANMYYTMTVASMLENSQNFFFGSLDTAGSVTVDKPPVTFWIQTISAKIFGLHGWSVVLPQALAGVGSVLIIYFLVKPSFGTTAARLAALAMATTPIAAAVSRTNNIDSMLVFTLLIATWLIFRGVKRNSVWSLLGAFAVIGVAFNMKMLQAYMVLPAFYLFYLLASKMKWKKKIGILAGATAIMMALSLSWALIVDSIPEDDRPYIGSSETNSVLELAFGYNGLSRLTGNQGSDGGAPAGNRQDGTDMTNEESQTGQSLTGTTDDQQGIQPGDGDVPSGAMNGSTGGPTGMGDDDGSRGDRPGSAAGGSFGTGEKGPLRLFQSALSGQASWLLPFAAFASISVLAGWRRKNMTLKHKETVFWLTWLIPVMMFFSIAGFFHHYYLIMLAPPIAALFGAGWTQLYADYRNGTGWKSWLLPIAVFLTAGFQWYIIQPYDDVIGSGWSIGIAALGVLFTLILVFLKYRETSHTHFVSVAALLVLLIGPLYWAATPIMFGGNSMLPQAGPSSEGEMGRFAGGTIPTFNGQGGDGEDNMNPEVPENDASSGADNSMMDGAVPKGMPPNMTGNRQGGMNGESLDEKTLSYLKKNNTGETYLFATTSYTVAAPYIIDKQESVITMGGFSGSDPVYTVEELEELVKSGKLKYFIISERGMGGGSSKVTEWIKEHGKEISSEEWKTTSNNNDGGFDKGHPGGSNTLYEVKI